MPKPKYSTTYAKWPMKNWENRRWISYLEPPSTYTINAAIRRCSH